MAKGMDQVTKPSSARQDQPEQQAEGSGKNALMTVGLVLVLFGLLLLFYFWKVGAVDFIYSEKRWGQGQGGPGEAAGKVPGHQKPRPPGK